MRGAKLLCRDRLAHLRICGCGRLHRSPVPRALVLGRGGSPCKTMRSPTASDWLSWTAISHVARGKLSSCPRGRALSYHGDPLIGHPSCDNSTEGHTQPPGRARGSGAGSCDESEHRSEGEPSPYSRALGLRRRLAPSLCLHSVEWRPHGSSGAHRRDGRVLDCS